MDKQSWAKLGVIALLGVNVAGYYYFWPRRDEPVKPAHERIAKTPAKSANQEKRAPWLTPASDSDRTAPRPLPVQTVSKLELPLPQAAQNAPGALVIPEPPPPTEQMAIILPDPHPIVPAAASENLARELPRPAAVQSAIRDGPARIDPPEDDPAPDVVVPAALVRDQPGAASAVASVAAPPLPTAPPGLWKVQIEKAGQGARDLTARLHNQTGERVLAEFRIQCERVETDPQTGAVRAAGNVRFSGNGWTGTCRVLSVPIHEGRMICEGGVRVFQDVLGSSQDGGLVGERIIWELPPAPQNPVGVTAPLGRQ